LKAGAPGCGTDNFGDIGEPTPIVIAPGGSYAYDFTNCFTGGSTAGWKHTIIVAPTKGTLLIVGSVVTYTANMNATGTDHWQISSPSVSADGATSLCSCNLQGTFSIVSPPTPAPSPPTGMLVLTGVAVLGIFEIRRRVRRCS